MKATRCIPRASCRGVTDITAFQFPAGKVCLSPIIDCFDGMVISWTIGTSPDAELVNTMLDAAIETVVDTNAGQSSILILGPTIVGLAGYRGSGART